MPAHFTCAVVCPTLGLALPCGGKWLPELSQKPLCPQLVPAHPLLGSGPNDGRGQGGSEGIFPLEPHSGFSKGKDRDQRMAMGESEMGQGWGSGVTALLRVSEG